MTRFLNSMLLCLIVLSPAAFAKDDAAGTASGTDVQIAELLNQIQRALITVQDSAASENLPKLNSVIVELQTQFKKEGGGGLSLFVVTLGAKASKEEVQMLKLTLKPPEVGAKMPVSAADVYQSLAEAILAAAKGAAAAKTREPRLELSELVATIKFVVLASGGGGIRFTIAPVSIDLSGNVSDSTTQTISVTFK